MKRALYGFGLALAIALGGWGVLYWMHSPPLPEADLEQHTSYNVDPAPADQDTFTVMTYNLGYLASSTDPYSGAMTDSAVSTRLDEALALIRRVDPDVIGLQEATMGVAPAGPPHQLDTLARRLNMFATAGAVRRNERSILPFRRGLLASGQGILSRYPLRRHVRRELTRMTNFPWVPRPPTDAIVQVAAVGIGGWPLITMNVNLDAESPKARMQQAEEINRLYRQLARQGLPLLVLGSIHGPPGSSQSTSTDPAAQTILSNEILDRLVEGTSLRPALSPEEALVTGQNVATYPSDDPAQKVDYIFYHPGRVVPIHAKTWCTETRSAPSEHCPVSLSFYLPRPVDQLPDAPIPDDKLPSLDSLMGPAPSE